MDDVFEAQKPDYVTLTGDVVSAFVSNNSIPTADLAGLIESVHQALQNLKTSSSSGQDKSEKATPAQIRKSITPDALVSFEDGKPYKTLRRHLTIRGLTPEMYRAKHGLPVDYPMTSATYSAQRSALAQSLGLGRHRQEVETVATPPAKAEPPKSEASKAEPPKAGKGRPRKTPAASVS